MQIKFFTIPVMGGEALEAELNAFLRSSTKESRMATDEQAIVPLPAG